MTLLLAMNGFKVISKPDLAQHHNLSSTAAGYRSRAVQTVVLIDDWVVL